MTELILIRHGETDWNVEQRIQGHLDIPLNRAGLAQAEAIGSRFRDIKIDVLLSSDLCRALQTVAHVSESCNLPVLREARLRERHLGILQGKTREEAEQQTPEAFKVFRSRVSDAPLDEGESLVAFAQRVLDLLAELTLVYRDKRIVAVTHGGVLDIIYRYANKTPLEAPRTFPIPNASVSTFRIENGHLNMLDWSDISHLLDASVLDDV